MPIIKAGPFKLSQETADHFIHVIAPEGNYIRLDKCDVDELIHGIKKIFGMKDKLFHDPMLPTCQNCNRGSIVNTAVDSYCLNCDGKYETY